MDMTHDNPRHCTYDKLIIDDIAMFSYSSSEILVFLLFLKADSSKMSCPMIKSIFMSIRKTFMDTLLRLWLFQAIDTVFVIEMTQFSIWQLLLISITLITNYLENTAWWNHYHISYARRDSWWWWVRCWGISSIVLGNPCVNGAQWPPSLNVLTLIPAWISNYIHHKVWGKLLSHSQTSTVQCDLQMDK